MRRRFPSLLLLALAIFLALFGVYAGLDYWLEHRVTSKDAALERLRLAEVAADRERRQVSARRKIEEETRLQREADERATEISNDRIKVLEREIRDLQRQSGK